MRKYRIILIIPVVLFIIWIGTLLHAHHLTISYGEEFSEANIAGFDYMHPWDGEPNFRIIYYSQFSAIVYYYTETGGEKVLLNNYDGTWNYNQTLSIWSTQGSADDYFIWPYFKDYVP